jgi:hypothetical protein
MRRSVEYRCGGRTHRTGLKPKGGEKKPVVFVDSGVMISFLKGNPAARQAYRLSRYRHRPGLPAAAHNRTARSKSGHRKRLTPTNSEALLEAKLHFQSGSL